MRPTCARSSTGPPLWSSAARRAVRPFPGRLLDCGPADPGRVAFVFPGQGSQYIGMGGDIAMAFPSAQHVWDFAAGLDAGERALGDVVFPVPAFTDEQRAAQELRLTDTRWAQPALAAHSLSMLALLTSIGVEPDCAVGHSLGELVALHAAGPMDAESLLRLARRRGELLAQIDAEPGAMLAVGADADTVASAIKESTIADLWLANINAPRQTVVSGTVRAIEALHGRLSAVGIDCAPPRGVGRVPQLAGARRGGAAARISGEPRADRAAYRRVRQRRRRDLPQ